MNSRLIELALAKQRLTLRSDDLRQQFAAAASDWKPAFSVVDRLRQGVDWLRRRPLLLVALAVALLVARPRAVVSLAGRGWLAWRMFRGLSGRLREVQAIGVGLGRSRKAGVASASDRRSR